MNTSESISMETRTIERFPNYRFTRDGRVISLINRKARYLKPARMGEYSGVNLLDKDRKGRKLYLHRLICEAFNGPCPKGMQCRHLDGNKENNMASNLSWGTAIQNNQDKIAHGTNGFGERNPMARLKSQSVIEMRKLRSKYGTPYSKLAKQFGVSAMTAFRAITGRSWNTVTH